jgi:hypothetical protein
MTGGRLTIGLAGENAPGVSLRYSLTASCKAGDFPPDIVNRVIPCFFSQLSTEAREGDAGTRLTSGLASLEIRLAALHVLQTSGIVEHLRSVAKNSKAWRYPWHVAIADFIYKNRTGLDADTTIKEAVQAMQGRLTYHSAQAEASGLLTQLREGVQIDITLPTFFDNLTDMDIGQLMHLAEPHGHTLHGARWLTAAAIVRARKEAFGTNRAGVLLEALTGLRVHVTDRTLIRVLLADVRSRIPAGGSWTIPGTGYKITRTDADDEATYSRIMVKIEAEPQTIQQPQGI